MEVVEDRCWMAREIAGQTDEVTFRERGGFRSESKASVERDMPLL